MAKKVVVNRVKRSTRAITPVVVVEHKIAKRVRMPSPGDVVNDVTVEKTSTLVGTPRTVVTPGSALQKKNRAA